jgi:hypothetical protein
MTQASFIPSHHEQGPELNYPVPILVAPEYERSTADETLLEAEVASTRARIDAIDVIGLMNGNKAFIRDAREGMNPIMARHFGGKHELGKEVDRKRAQINDNGLFQRQLLHATARVLGYGKAFEQKTLENAQKARIDSLLDTLKENYFGIQKEAERKAYRNELSERLDNLRGKNVPSSK